VAQCNLGICYDNGKGVEKSATEAYAWYRKAAEQGDVRARALGGLLVAADKAGGDWWLKA